MATILLDPAVSAADPAIRTRWIGRVLSTIAILMLALDAVMKLIAPQLMIDHTPPLGLPADVGFYRILGAILLAALALHVWPRTALIGAVLVTGYLGGAVAINLRAGMPLFGHVLFGVYIGAVLWGGFLLRNARLRALMLGQ